MIRTYHREKLINAIIYFSKNTQFCGKTKLMKLLYFLDFWHFKQTGNSVTGSDYLTLEWGPVPGALWNEMDKKMKPDLSSCISIIERPDTKLQKVVAKCDFNEEFFTERELELLENIAFMFRDVTAPEISEISHLPNQPWKKTLDEKGEWKRIDYLLALDETKDSLSSDDAKEKMDEIAEMYNNFGAA